jgi:hypothetical protein
MIAIISYISFPFQLTTYNSKRYSIILIYLEKLGDFDLQANQFVLIFSTPL